MNLVYDIIIHSDTCAEHVQQVAIVLESLRQMGLTANLKKCVSREREGTVSGEVGKCACRR